MKKVLVIGAAGTLGQNVIKYLLAEGKFEITALDLKNKKVHKNLHKYRKRIKIFYGDLLDQLLIENLVKNQDYVVNLATCLPPMSIYNNKLVSLVEENGTKELVKTIKLYNPKCHLIYTSTTSLYDGSEVTVNSKIKIINNDFYSQSKYNSEKFIQKDLKNYTILRIPLILSDLRIDPFIYNVQKNEMVEVISKEDASYAVVSAIIHSEKINKKILNIGGGHFCRCYFKEILYKILKSHGISFKMLNTRIFISKNYHSPVLLDSDESNNILKYRNDSIESYFMRQKRRSKKRKISLFLAKIFMIFYK